MSWLLNVFKGEIQQRRGVHQHQQHAQGLRSLLFSCTSRVGRTSSYRRTMDSSRAHGIHIQQQQIMEKKRHTPWSTEKKKKLTIFLAWQQLMNREE
ncbi:hypothetical protein LR48_Vigan02g177900 [Vigna angularis]|uniref:Uncharacterized protein n=2 Tax=Phaseolus angularis TaxID=3914 RepID=A0A0L9TZM3_PHAAN|nr:hypothetical protein LR48_Vigan02g177900 [Vigna angularis]BAT94854.1 hypothetical protein VIGAN_08150000 [Vigna angularis var. angularis]